MKGIGYHIHRAAKLYEDPEAMAMARTAQSMEALRVPEYDAWDAKQDKQAEGIEDFAFGLSDFEYTEV